MSVLSNYMEITRSPVFGVLIVITFISFLLITLKATESEGFENNLTIEDLMANCEKNEIIDIINKKCIEKNVSINKNGSVLIKDSKNNLLYKLNSNGKIKIDNVKYNQKDSKELLQNVVSEIAGNNIEIEIDDQNTDEADHVFDEVDDPEPAIYIPVEDETLPVPNPETDDPEPVIEPAVEPAVEPVVEPAVEPTPAPNPETDEKVEKPADVVITSDGLEVTAAADIELDDDDDEDDDGVSFVTIIIILISLLGLGGIGYFFYSKSLADIEI